MTDPLRVLHLTGSPTSDFFAQLSCAYARDCLTETADPSLYEFIIAYLSPDGRWRFPDGLDDASLAEAETYSEREAFAKLETLRIDVVVPQMFCLRGMTDSRTRIEAMGLPLVGNPGELMALTANKAETKPVVAAAGVRVPSGSVVTRQGAGNIELDELRFPVVVKPASADNSVGVALVHDAEELRTAIDAAFEVDDTVLIEEFIPLGREVRCGVLERGGELVCLPLQEYAMDAETNPIRDYASKLCEDGDGKVDLTSKYKSGAWIVNEADPDMPRVWEAAKACYHALDCRDYGLFDFRIAPDGEPVFLEAGLYCSFSPKSIVVVMAEAAGIPLRDLFADALHRAGERSAAPVAPTH